MGNTNNFEFSGKLRRLFYALIGLGIAAVVVGALINPEIGSQRLWANFLLNTIFFLGIALLGLFFIATHTMAYGGWHVLIRRIPEALSTFIPVGSVLLLVIVLGTYLGAHHLYHWSDTFLIQEQVTVQELRDYEAGMHHGSEEHHEEGAEHSEEGRHEEQQSNAAGHAAPVLTASLLQDHHETPQQAEGHGETVVVQHAAADGTHADTVTILSDTLAGHQEGQAADGHHEDAHHAGSAAAAAHSDGHGHGEESYSWYHGKVSAQADGHHGPETYAAAFASEPGDKTIENPHYDALLAHKAPFLNKNFFLIRFLFYIAIWISLAWLIRRASLREDAEGGLSWYIKSKKYSAIYMVLFGITSSTMAWDFLMSIDSHWFSTLYGWYNAASLWIACVAATTLLVIFLKNQGYLPQVNENHLHDLGKYLFGFSVFWTYLWFSQYMLIWYANLPEETFYYHMRNGDPAFRALFFINLGMNFFVPFFVLITRGAKRRVALMTVIAISLLCTHWLDLFLEIMPGTVGHAWSIGLVEIGMAAAFAGLFLLVVFRSLSRASLVPQKHPFYLESVNHHT